jgi:hypothetical protein
MRSCERICNAPEGHGNSPRRATLSYRAPGNGAPVDLLLQTATVTLPVPAAGGGSIVIDPTSKLREINRANHRVEL